MELSTQQKKKLRSIAHGLSPIVTIGQHGIKETIHIEIDKALDYHQLLKVKIAVGDKEERESLIELISKQHNATTIQSAGNMAVFYKRNRDKEDITKF